MVDLEKAVINDISKHFPVTKRRDCLINFAQSIWRHVQQKYIEDSDFAFL